MLYLNNQKKPTDLTFIYKSKTNNSIYQCNGSVVFPPVGRCIIVGFNWHTTDKTYPQEFIKQAIKNDIGIVYVCNELPNCYTINDHIVYIVTGQKWFSHFLFRDTTKFKGVFYNNSKDAITIAKEFANRDDVKIPLLGDVSDLKQLKQVRTNFDKTQKNIIIESFDGMGDVLLSMPIAKTLNSRGYKVSYLVSPENKHIFENISYIDKVYSSEEAIDSSSFAQYVSLSNKLSDYTQEYNKQHRIYAAVSFFDLLPSDLVTDKPELILSEEETNFADNLFKGHINTVGIAWKGYNSRRTYPKDLTQQLCSVLKTYGYTAVILSTDNDIFKDAINLGGKLTTRQLFAVVNKVDYIVTVDTGILHIAGAFDKHILALFGPIPSEWRCATYPNCKVIKPLIPCCPCGDGQWVVKEKRLCDRDNAYCLSSILPTQIASALTRLKDPNFLNIKDNTKFLINRTPGIGDVLMATSIAHYIKETKPNAYIAFRTEHVEILENNLDISEIIPTKFVTAKENPPNKYKYHDYQIIDLDYCCESPLVCGSLAKISEEDYMNVTRIDLFFRMAGLPTPKEPKMIYKVSDKEKEYAREKLSTLKTPYKICYVLSATSSMRTYPLELTRETLRLLTKYFGVVIVGDKTVWKNRTISNLYDSYFPILGTSILDMSDKTTIREAIALASQCDMIITPDTGFVHISNALNIPCIALFGNIDPKLRCQYYKNVIPLFHKLSCTDSCGDRGVLIHKLCPSFENVARKELIGAFCMRTISPLEIYQTAIKIVGIKL